MHSQVSSKVRVATKSGLQLLGSVLYWALDKQSERGSEYHAQETLVKKYTVESALWQLGLGIGTAESVSETVIGAFQFEFSHLVEAPRLVGFLMDQKQMERPAMLEMFPLLDRRIPISQCNHDTGLVGLLLKVFEHEISCRKYPARTQSRAPGIGHISALELLAHELLSPESGVSHRPKDTGYVDDIGSMARDVISLLPETKGNVSEAIRIAGKKYVLKAPDEHFEPGVIYSARDATQEPAADPWARVRKEVSKIQREKLERELVECFGEMTSEELAEAVLKFRTTR